MTLVDAAVLAGLTPVRIIETGDWKFAYLPLEDGTVKITDSRYIGQEPPPDVFHLPETIDGMTVSALGRRSIGSSGFREAVIPACITGMEENPFAYRPTYPEEPVLERITVAEGHPVFTSVDGVLFDQGGSRLLSFPRGRKGRYAVPEGTTAIAGLAFIECSGLTEIILPEGLLSIGEEAISRCMGLERIVLPATLRQMAPRAFHSCRCMKEAVLPRGMTELPDDTFRMCLSLERVTLPEGLRRIGSHAFYGCVGLTEASLPEGLEELSDCAFTCCKVLPAMTLPASLTSIGSRNFDRCPALTVTVQAGSAAEAYAKANGIPFAIKA